MHIDTKDLLNSILASLDRVDYIKAMDIPNIDLYMDQVTTFMDKRLRKSTRDPNEDKILTRIKSNNDILKTPNENYKIPSNLS